MATTAQIEANRRNARKSTGPRTEAGKARSKLNAYKHGRRAKPVMPVLPEPDPAELQERIRRWVEDMKPADAPELKLVERAARTALELDALDRLEADGRARRLQDAQDQLARATADRVGDLGRKLLAGVDARERKIFTPDRDDHPEAFLRGLEDSAEGCRWLLDRWAELKHTLDRGDQWKMPDLYRLVRLQGKRPLAAIDDPELNRQFLAWEVIRQGAATTFWQYCQTMTPPCDPGFSEWMAWREIVDRPASEEEAMAVIGGVIDGRMARLEEMLGLYEEVADEEAAAAWFDPGPEAEGVRKRQAALTRELRQLIELILKMQAARRKRTNPDEPRSRGGRGEEGGRPDEIRETTATEGTEDTEGEGRGDRRGANEADPEDRDADTPGIEGEAGSAAGDTGRTHGTDERSREAAAGGEGRPGAAGPHDRQRGEPTAASREGLVEAGAGDEAETADGSPNRTDKAKMEMLKTLVRQWLTEVPGGPAADNRSQSDGARRSDQGGDREGAAGGMLTSA